MPTPRPEADDRPVGVLALQGSFPLHVGLLNGLDVHTRLVRRAEDLVGLRGLVLPGGESTTMSILADKYGLTSALRETLAAGLPAFGTCAGAILLGRAGADEPQRAVGDGPRDPERLEIAPVALTRNAYGRQLDSFTETLKLSIHPEPFHGVFIRAPRIVEPEDDSGVEVLGRRGDEPVLVRWRHVLLATFHPELTSDSRVHRYFLGMCSTPTPSARVASA